jgi:hypothetical protein
MTPRAGLTLVELLASLALAGIAGAVMLSTLVKQQRFHASAAEILDSRAQLLDAAGILATDIRAAAVDLGVPVMSDSAIEMFTVIASSIVCTTESPQSFGLPPLRLASGVSLGSLLVLPDTADLALVYTTSWELRRVRAFVSRSASTACPASTPFTEASDVVSGIPAFAVTLQDPPANPVNAGAPILFVRRSRYSIYRSADGKWYLGYRRCAALGPSVCAVIQPVAGPFNPSPGGVPGLSFRYFDSRGSGLGPASDGRTMARVDFVIRGRSARNARLSGDPGSPWTDSIVASVATRNRSR